jgi:hypothetical protein
MFIIFENLHCKFNYRHECNCFGHEDSVLMRFFPCTGIVVAVSRASNPGTSFSMLSRFTVAATAPSAEVGGR